MASYLSLEYTLFSFVFVTLLYSFYVIAWRIYFSPYAKYPGPKLAAATRWYEFYYDVIKGGRFTWEIQRLHDIYGPILRVGPEEIHISDPNWLDEHMTGNSRPRDKTEAVDGRSGRSSVFGTLSHDHHRLRRGALNPFFSMKSIMAIEPLIQDKVDRLCFALSHYADTEEPVELGLAFTALALDTISHYAYGKSYGLLDQPGFSQMWSDVVWRTMESFATVRNLPWLFVIMKSLPRYLQVLLDEPIAFYLQMELRMREEVTEIIKDRRRSTAEKGFHKNIFEELIDSNLPSQEKTVERLTEEGFVLLLAGTDTTSQTLSHIVYHLLDNEDALSKLQLELEEAIPDPKTPLSWRELEKLPYLKACIKEGMRIGAIATSRLTRVAPNETLHYKEWVIEPGTAVGMTTHFIHLDPALFPSPLEYQPQRWLQTGERLPIEKYFLPFNKGSRNCVGMNLANAEIYLTVANMFRRLNVRLYKTCRDDITIVRDAMIGHPKRESNGVRVKISRRTKG